MKRCPSCLRIYEDETLNFCLDDGEWLIDKASEPPTAILSSEAPNEAPTRQQFISGTPSPAPRESNGNPHRSRIFLYILIPSLLVAAGVIYRYFPYSDGRQIESIAVMPFVNASGNPDMEYLSDGITETLIGSLSQISGLNVKAPSSIFRYKG